MRILGRQRDRDKKLSRDGDNKQAVVRLKDDWLWSDKGEPTLVTEPLLVTTIDFKQLRTANFGRLVALRSCASKCRLLRFSFMKFRIALV